MMRLIVSLMVSLMALGCAGAELSETPSAASSYHATVAARVEAARTATSYRLRFNPTDCRCPVFELRLGDRWHRVDLAVGASEDPSLVALVAATDETDEQLGRTYSVDGVLTAQVGRCGAGTAVVTLELTGFGGVSVRELSESGP